MLGLSARPSGQLAGDKRFADLYRSAVCKWIEDVTGVREFSIHKAILFLSTSTYRDMASGNLPCISSVAGLWIEERTKDGGIPDYVITLKDGSPCTNKVPCLFQQYTSHGKFAVFGKDRSIDLDRFFGSEDDLRKLLIKVE
jgi:hypothetical protein